jgi:hypothetical protein
MPMVKVARTSVWFKNICGLFEYPTWAKDAYQIELNTGAENQRAPRPIVRNPKSIWTLQAMLSDRWTA